MDKKASATLEKLSQSVSVIAESMTQLRLDIEKMGARIGAIDTELASISRHLRGGGNGSQDEQNRRDLALERAVFGQMSKRPIPKIREKAAYKAGRKSPKSEAAKRTAKPTAKRKR
jgi:hypothetical protein